ncbi:MAG: hypothetical protein JWO12_1050 [Frankiales bacterium]|nr:hypothetical protein [Frankiales bacterium]
MTARAFLVARGAAEVAHASGTLFDHLERVAARLASWGCAEAVVTAGLVHVAYSTDGFDVALLGVSERDVLREAVGAPAEELAYRFGAMEQGSFLRQLGQPLVIWTDRFTGTSVTLDPPEVAPLVQLWLANELDAYAGAQLPPGLLSLIERARPYLPPQLAGNAVWT